MVISLQITIQNVNFYLFCYCRIIRLFGLCYLILFCYAEYILAFDLLDGIYLVYRYLFCRPKSFRLVSLSFIHFVISKILYENSFSLFCYIIKNNSRNFILLSFVSFGYLIIIHYWVFVGFIAFILLGHCQV